MVHLQSFETLLINQLRDLYSAEYQMVEALPKMVEAASSPNLKEAFEYHLEQSREHVRRLDKVFAYLGHTPWGQQCEAMAGLIKEGEEIIQVAGELSVKDAALIAALQRIEHYEIASYGTVRAYAGELGFNKVESLLQQTLEEEEEADKKLIKLAEGSLFGGGINREAAQ